MALNRQYSDSIIKILSNLYRIKIPLSQSPLKYVNSYLIKGKDRSLIIDTGMNRDECYRAMMKALNILNVDLTKTDFLITHLHPDHIGLIRRLAVMSKVYLSDIEMKIVNKSAESASYWNKMNEYLIKNGFPKNELDVVFNSMNNTFVKTYIAIKTLKTMKFHALYDNDTITYGNLEFKTIITPGHSPGHICLYNKDEEILISGDHILFDITPNITFWPTFENSLNSYFESLDKIYPLTIKLTLPGHGEPGASPKKRIKTIKDHHKKRFKEILKVIDEQGKTAYDIASLISWNIKYGEWNFFPKTQKYFAVGETIAHLIYLEKERLVRKKEKNKIIYYSKI